MIKPKSITFTGIDARTDPTRVMDLSARYPVEWGILFSPTNQGQVPRYPALRDISKFLEVCVYMPEIQFSAHLCGGYSRQVMAGESLGREMIGFLWGNFDRTQINVADGETHVDERDIRVPHAAAFADEIGAEEGAIIQCRGAFPNDPGVAWLYDKSGGAGRAPDSWDAGAGRSHAFCGYAGGIGPHNVVSVLEAIEPHHPKGKGFWIDMEGQIRTQDWLDLDKCEAVLKAVYG
jgi:hypothetical protein